MGLAIGRIVGQPAGWATSLADSGPVGFDGSLLPVMTLAQRVGDGTVILLGDNPANPPINEVLALRAAMGYELPQKSTRSEEIPGDSKDSAATNQTGTTE